MIAKKLETKIRDAILSGVRSHGSSSSSLFSQDSTGLSNLQRPRRSSLIYMELYLTGTRSFTHLGP